MYDVTKYYLGETTNRDRRKQIRLREPIIMRTHARNLGVYINNVWIDKVENSHYVLKGKTLSIPSINTEEHWDNEKSPSNCPDHACPSSVLVLGHLDNETESDSGVVWYS